MLDLIDSYGRKFVYLRLSLTEVCNFRCSYCLPNGYRSCGKTENPLSLSEIENLIRAFSELGVSKVRLTGGEPMLRRDLAAIVSALRNIPEIKTVALTTNGFCFPKGLKELKEAGLTSINISVDSLNSKTFLNITGHDRLKQILEGLELSQSLGFETLKINTVLLQGINSTEFDSFVDFVRDRPLEARFIELMRTGDNEDYFQRHFMSPQVLIEDLCLKGWKEKPTRFDSGPARVFVHSKYQGSIGFISPYSKDFCRACNRLRVSSFGGLRLCLFGKGDISLRRWLQSPDQKYELLEVVRDALKLKKESHLLNGGEYGDMYSLSAIGG